MTPDTRTDTATRAFAESWLRAVEVALGWAAAYLTEYLEDPDNGSGLAMIGEFEIDRAIALLAPVVPDRRPSHCSIAWGLLWSTRSHLTAARWNDADRLDGVRAALDNLRQLRRLVVDRQPASGRLEDMPPEQRLRRNRVRLVSVADLLFTISDGLDDPEIGPGPREWIRQTVDDVETILGALELEP